ncbi:MAG: arylesterase [Candidatus Omnitrophica bacterium]|nr:arylesterase [Candidatus Omnitrophota bacterium]
MKNKFIKLLVIVLLVYCVVALISFKKPEIKNKNNQGKDIICFGDSITFGYGVSAKENYPTALSKMVTYLVVNSGIDADTSVEALGRLDSDVLSRQPFLVIIEFCGNDFLRKIPIEITEKNIREMTRQIQQSGAMVAIVDISAGMFLKDYRRMFRKIAYEEGAIFVPAVLNGIITNPSMKSDFLHPNGSGYKIVAERVYKAILSYLN